MNAEFEEKAYEDPLYVQLLTGGRNIWTPGQVFEHSFGIDGALLSDDPRIWNALGYNTPLKGVVVNDLRWGFVWRDLGRRRQLPRFRVNMLIQVKRPTFLKRRPSGTVEKSLGSPYWRFDVTPHQQKILEQVEKRARRRALVTYASPAFHEDRALYFHTENNSLVENSTFVRPSVLAGHDQWLYDRPGSQGVGCSDPEEIHDEPFLSRIAEALENDGLASERADRGGQTEEAIANLSAFVSALVESTSADEPTNNAREIEFRRRAAMIRALENVRPVTRSFFTAVAFMELFRLSWLVAV